MAEKCKVPSCEGTLVYVWNERGCLRLVCLKCGVVLGPDYQPVQEKAEEVAPVSTVSTEGE